MLLLFSNYYIQVYLVMYHYTIVSTPIVTLQGLRDLTTIFWPKIFISFWSRYRERERGKGNVFITSFLMILMGKIFFRTLLSENVLNEIILSNSIWIIPYFFFKISYIFENLRETRPAYPLVVAQDYFFFVLMTSLRHHGWYQILWLTHRLTHSVTRPAISRVAFVTESWSFQV